MDGIDLPSWVALLPLVVYGLATIAAALHTGGRVNRRASASLAAAGAASMALIAVNALLRGGSEHVTGWSLAAFARFELRLDPLAAFFLIVISVPAIAAAIYGFGYLDHVFGHGHGHQSAGLPPRDGIDAAVALFLLSLSVLVLADSVFAFMIAWEAMSLISFFLVLGDGDGRQRRGAAFTYIVMTHVASVFVLIAFFALSRHAQSFDFAAIRASAASLPGRERDVVFVAALIGFGTKAGLIPLHVWLPRAHPAAPSPVSALMSGVMVKMAIFGLIRVLFEFTGTGPRWWGVTLLAAGGVSAVLGVLYALMERDLKRMLAYSTVEQLGLITLGLGAASLLQTGGYPGAAAFALVALLVHLLNHSLFKSLLFLGAGAVDTGAGTRDLERLGGLIHRMPRTAALFLIGAMSIAALPPLNGFAGEWLLFQSMLRLGTTLDTTAMMALAAGAAGALALTTGLAVACFVRAFGIGFLGQPRTQAAREAREVPISMQAGMGLLAAGCVVLGLATPVVFRLLRPVTQQLTGETTRPGLGLSGAFNPGQTAGHYSPALGAAVLIGLGVVPWLVARVLGGPGRTRIAPPWVCGFELEPRMPYTATAFAKPLRIIFGFVIRPVRRVELDAPISPLFVRAVRYDESVHPIYDRYLYRRLVQTTYGAARRIRPLQSGSVRVYLSYIFVTLVVAILLAR